MESWTREHGREGDGQVRRVARRFALIAPRARSPCDGILPWMKGGADLGVARCFEDWLAQRGGTEPSEERSGIERLRGFIAKHGTSRFHRCRPGAQIPTGLVSKKMALMAQAPSSFPTPLGGVLWSRFRDRIAGIGKARHA